MAGAIHSTGKNTYNTPERILAPIRSFWNGVIELDPCSNLTSLVNAKDNIVWPARDGLVETWGSQKTYVNPPFSVDKKSVVGKWVSKAHVESQCGAEVIMLIPASPETDWWQNIIFPKAQGICWLDFRVTFVGEKHCIPKPIALVYFGRYPGGFCSHFRQLGHTYNPSEIHA